MTELRNRRTALLYSLVLLAFLIRSFIPVGFMPGQTVEKLSALVICSATGAATAHVAANTIPGPAVPVQQHNDAGSTHIPCAFAHIFASGTVPAPPQWIAMPMESASLSPAVPNTIPAGITVKPYFSQGPPSPLHS